MKLGIFFSKCDGVVGGAIDLETIAKEYESYESAAVFENFYDPEEFDEILRKVEENDLDALVLAGESPLTYMRTRSSDFLFKCLSEKGINSNRIEIVNLVGMLVLAHKAPAEELEAKARLLIDVGIEKVRHSEKVDEIEVSPRKAVAVVGANIGGLTVSQVLLDEGYKVFLIHDGSDMDIPAERLKSFRPLFTYVARHPRFQIFLQATTKEFYGYTGDYTLKVESEGETIELPVGAVVLSLGNDRKKVKASHSTFRIDVKEDGSAASLDEFSARSQTRERGIFIINPSKDEQEDVGHVIVAADAAAAMVIHLLNRSEIHHRMHVSRVDPDLCGACGACVKTCMFHAVTIGGDPPVSSIDSRRCRGCGNCVTVCPAGARDLLSYPSQYLFRAVDIYSDFMMNNGNPKVLLIACEECGYQCLDQSAEMSSEWPIGVMPLKVVCGGQIDMQLLMYAFAKGFDGVVLMICGEGCCHNIIGNVDLERRVNLFRTILSSRGIDDQRLRIVSTCSRKGGECIHDLNEFYNQLASKPHFTETVMV